MYVSQTYVGEFLESQDSCTITTENKKYNITITAEVSLKIPRHYSSPTITIILISIPKYLYGFYFVFNFI